MLERQRQRLAGELNCVIGLSQLNDDGKLRESRASDQDANALIGVDTKDSDGGKHWSSFSAAVHRVLPQPWSGILSSPSLAMPHDRLLPVTSLSRYTHQPNQST